MKAFAQKEHEPVRPGVFLIRPRPGTIVIGKPNSGSPAFLPLPLKAHFKASTTRISCRLTKSDSCRPVVKTKAMTKGHAMQSTGNQRPYGILNSAQGSKNTPMNSFSTSRKLAWSPAFSTLPARTTDGTALSGRPNFSSPTTGRFFRTSPSSKPFQRRKNLKPSASRILSPRASSKYEFFPRQTVRNGHPLPRSGCLSGDELRLVSKK